MPSPTLIPPVTTTPQALPATTTDASIVWFLIFVVLVIGVTILQYRRAE